MQELESFGLVVKFPNRGSYVIDLHPMDLIHIYQVRSELEPLAWFLAAAQMKQQTLDRLRSCVEEMRDAARKRDYRAYSSLDYRFHCLIWESPLLGETVGQIQSTGHVAVRVHVELFLEVELIRRFRRDDVIEVADLQAIGGIREMMLGIVPLNAYVVSLGSEILRAG